MLNEEAYDGLTLAVHEPEIAPNEAIMFVGLALAFSPLIKLGAGDAQPLHQAGLRDFRLR